VNIDSVVKATQSDAGSVQVAMPDFPLRAIQVMPVSRQPVFEVLNMRKVDEAFSDCRTVLKSTAGPDAEARLAVLRQVAQEHGATANQVVLAWMLQHTPPVLPLIAASTSAQLEENLDALRITLTGEQMQRLDSGPASRLHLPK
jgi:aryl-alcohol dehydrogenase-like predicted oxidoreductase